MCLKLTKRESVHINQEGTDEAKSAGAIESNVGKREKLATFEVVTGS